MRDDGQRLLRTKLRPFKQLELRLRGEHAVDRLNVFLLLEAREDF